MKRWHVLTGVSLAAIVVVGAVVVDVFPRELAPIEQIDQASFSSDQIDLGENLSLLGDCAACHKPAGTQAMSGGVALPTPFGTIYSTNITPDVATGIGSWSHEAFVRAMREGVDRKGNHLYPAFPYDHFAAVTDDDLDALYQYLMTQDPVASEPVANTLRFPFSFRPILAGWKLLFHRQDPFSPNPDFTDEENRGAYLAETLGHCSACHSPRNILGAVKKSAYLAGGAAEGWLIPPLGSASIAPVGWDVDDYADYLFDGWSERHGIAAGPMTEVVDNLHDANEDDVFAIAAWLAKITPAVDPAQREARATEIAALDFPESFDFAFPGQTVPEAILAGGQVFKTNCLKCHKERVAKGQPMSLGLTYAVNAPAPTNLFNVVLKGIEPPLGSSTRRMQPISLSAEDLAAVAGFVRWRFSAKPAWSDLNAAAKAAVEHAKAH